MLNSSTKQQGIATIIVSILLTLVISVVILMVAKMTVVEQRVSANEYSAKQAAEASQAGLQFGVPYLVANKSTIVRDTNSDGYIDAYSDSSTTNVVLGDGSKYTITYTNPTANNFDIIKVQSVGTTANGNITRTTRQLIGYYNTGVAHVGEVAVVTKNLVALSGNVNITNTTADRTMESGGLITVSGNVTMTTSSGTTGDVNDSDSGAAMNNQNLVNATNDQLFQNFFGTTMTTMRSRADIYYSGNANYNSQLHGKQGKIIFIDGNVNLSSTTTVGTTEQPVILIVNGNLNTSGQVRINGFVYATGNLNDSGGTNIQGVMATAGNFNASGNVSITYNPTVINNLNQGWQKYGNIAGSWRDF